MPRKRRMTLVEWLVVAAILGILATIVLPATQKAKQEAAHSPAADLAPAGGVVEQPADAGARETAAALKGFVLGVVATLVVMRLLRRAAARRGPDKQRGGRPPDAEAD